MEPINHFIMVSENINKWSDIFHSKLITNKLTTEYALKLLFMQKIKYFSQRKTTLTIFLDDFNLEEFELNPKIYTILKYNSIDYGIDIVYLNEYTNINDIFTESVKNHIKLLNDTVDSKIQK